MTTWADQEAAINMRDVITRIADTRIEALRPTPTYAVVQTINREARNATVLHVGDSQPVSVALGSIEPAQVGQTVRIGGLIGHRYVEDVLGNAIMSGNDTRYAPIAHTHTEGGATEFLLDDIGDVDTSTNPPTPSSVLGWNDLGGYWQPVSMDLGTSYLSLSGGTVTGPTTFTSTLTVNTTLTALGAVTGQSFTGVGTGLTFLNATELKSGTIPAARMPPTIPSSTTGTSAGWTTGRNLNLSGDMVGTVLIKGDADMNMSVALAANSIDLGTDTTGDYVAHIIGTANQVITNTVVATEGATHTLSLPQSIHIGAVPQFSRLTLGTATGLPPLAVTSTTRVDNLTVHYLGAVGQDDAFFRNAGSLNAGTIASARLSGPYTGITDVGTLTTLNVTGVAALGNNSTVNGQTIWHAGNDGAGSGLDAGLLGGVLPIGYASTEIMESLLGDLLAVGLYNAAAYNGQRFSMIFDRSVRSKIMGLTMPPGDQSFEMAAVIDLPEIPQVDTTTGENRRRVIASDSAWLDVARYGDDDHLDRSIGYAWTADVAGIQIDGPVVIRARVRKTDLDKPGIRQIARHGSTTATAYLDKFQTVSTPDTPDMEIDGRVRILHYFELDSGPASFSGTISKDAGTDAAGREMLFYFYSGNTAFSTNTTTGAQIDFGVANGVVGEHEIGVEVARGSTAVVNLVDGARVPATLSSPLGLINNSVALQVGGTTFDGRVHWAQMEAIDRAQLQYAGVMGNYLNVPAAPNLDILGPKTIFIDLDPLPSVRPYQVVCGQMADNRWQIYFDGPNLVFGTYLADGTTYLIASSGAVTALNGSRLRAALTQVTNGANVEARWFTSTDGVTWAPAGAAGVTAGAVAGSTSPLVIGDQSTGTPWPMHGRIRRVVIANGVGANNTPGGTPVLDVSENDTALMTAPQVFTVTSGQTATLTQTMKFEFPGIDGNYVAQTYAPPQAPPGDVEFVYRVSLPDWSSGAHGSLFCKNGAYYTFVAKEIVVWWFLADETAVYPASSEVLGFANGTSGWIKITRSATTGVTSYYSAPDSLEEPTTWTARGSSTGATGALRNPTDQGIMLGWWGGNPMKGRIRRAILRHGIGGTTAIDINESNVTTPGQATFAAAAGGEFYTNQTPGWQVVRNSMVVPQPNRLIWRFDPAEYPGSGTNYTDPRGRTWTLSAAGAIDPAIPNEAWTLYMDSGKLGLRASADGRATVSLDVLTAAELDTISNTADNSDFYVAASVNPTGSALEVRGWGSPNGQVWTTFGPVRSVPFAFDSLFNSSSGLYLGGQTTLQAWDGRIYWADMIPGGTPNADNEPIWRFNVADHIGGLSFAGTVGRIYNASAGGAFPHPVYQIEASLSTNGGNNFRALGAGGFHYTRNIGRQFHAWMVWNAADDILMVAYRDGEDLDLHASQPPWTSATATYSGDIVANIGAVEIGTRIGGAENWAFNGRMQRIWITKNTVPLLDLKNTDLTTLGQMTVTPTTGPLMTFSHSTMALTTMPKPIWAEGPTVYRHNMYWIVASGGEVDFIDSDLSGRYDVDVDDAVTVANGDWIVGIDPLFGSPGHEEGADLTLSQMLFQYIPFSAETFVKAKIQEHLSDTLDPHSAAGYLKTVIANTLYAPLVHTHEAEISSFIALHEAALDPHPGYLTQAEANGYYLKPGDLLPYEPQGAILAHEQKSDPHPQYVTHAEANQDYAVVDHLHNQYAQEGHTHSQFYEIMATDGAQSARLFIGDDLPFQPRIGDLWIQTFDIALQPPPAPANLTVAATTPTTIRLSWNAWDATVEQMAVQIERSPDGSTGWTLVFADAGSPAATTFTDTGLAQRTTYFYRVRATNLTGNGTWRIISAATTNAPPPPPTGLSISHKTGDSIRLNWVAVTAPPNDPMHASETYEVFRNGTFVAATANIYYDFGGLAENTQYTLGVRSKDNVGVASVLVTMNSGFTENSGPPVPTGLYSLTAGTDHIYLGWNPVTGISDFKEYWVSWIGYGIVATTTTTYLFSGLSPATNYSFQVRSVDTDGATSALSPVFTTSTLGAEDKVPPGPITNVSFKPRNNYGELWFEFDAPGDIAYGIVQVSVNGAAFARAYAGGMSGHNNHRIGTYPAGSTIYVNVNYRDISYNYYNSPNYAYTLTASPSSFTPHSSNSWRPTNGGEWNAQGDYKVVEGYYSNSALNSRGLWFYGSDFQNWWQAGRTITAANIFVNREGCGADQQDMISLYMHKLQVSPGTQSYWGNAPEFSGTAHDAGTVQYNESKWMAFPTSWAYDLCAGTWRGIGIANSGKPYACLHQSGVGNSGLIELHHLG